MTKEQAQDLRAVVQARYARVADQGSTCCGHDVSAEAVSSSLGYSDTELASAPEGANLGLGCGNPTAIASLQAGETVLDLGSGAGLDCFLAAAQVGPEGRVIGVDMTPEMVARARANATAAGVANVEFRLGHIEELPVESGTVDVVISNCVLNLSEDRPRALAEAYRVLKPGGRLVYATCSLLEDENEAVAAAFAAQHPDLQPLDAATILDRARVPCAAQLTSGPYLRLWPHRHKTDGFFAAVWQRRPA